MGQFNEEGLYIPSTPEEIWQEITDSYNKNHGTNFSAEELKFSNVANVLNIVQQAKVQMETSLALMTDQMISFARNKEIKASFSGNSGLGLEGALKQLDFIKNINVVDINSDSNIQQGSRSIFIDYDRTPLNDRNIARTLVRFAGDGIFYNGDIKVTIGSIITGNPVVTAWSKSVDKALKVKLTYKYSNSYYGNILSPDEIKDIYLKRFNEVYKFGNELEPATLNDISYYPGCSYVNSQFSIDAGETYKPINEILKLNNEEKATLVLENIEASIG